MKLCEYIFLLHSTEGFCVHTMPFNVHPAIGRNGVSMFSLHHQLQSTGSRESRCPAQEDQSPPGECGVPVGASQPSAWCWAPANDREAQSCLLSLNGGPLCKGRGLSIRVSLGSLSRQINKSEQ